MEVSQHFVHREVKSKINNLVQDVADVPGCLDPKTHSTTLPIEEKHRGWAGETGLLSRVWCKANRRPVADIPARAKSLTSGELIKSVATNGLASGIEGKKVGVAGIPLPVGTKEPKKRRLLAVDSNLLRRGGPVWLLRS